METELRALRAELIELREQLDERKWIERAKGILMKERDLSEAAAYALLRNAAMNAGRRIIDIARSVVTAASL